MYYTHSQSFKHCRTSVVTVVTKCTFSVALGESCCIIITLGVLFCSCFMSDQCCVINYSKFVMMLTFFSLFNLALLIPHTNKYGKVLSREPLPHSAFLNFSLCSLNPQAQTFPLGTTQCAVPAFYNCALRSFSG